MCLVVAILLLGYETQHQATTSPGGVIRSSVASGYLPRNVAVAVDTLGSHADVGTHVDNLQLARFDVLSGHTIGWQQHAGPVWLVVVEGTLTYYSGDDPGCHGMDYPAGSAILVPAQHIHSGRNEADGPLSVYSVMMLPAGGMAHGETSNPGICPFE